MTHLLVVDDEPAVRALCTRVLTQAGHVVDAAQGGEEAVARISDKPYDLVFSDLRMPGSPNGTELTKIIKQESPKTDVVIMTGYPTLESAVDTIKLGALDYLVKPLDIQTLLQAVDKSEKARLNSKEFDCERILREELQAAYIELEELDRLKEAFLARVNHELRTPFMAVSYHLNQLSPDGSESQMHLNELRGGLDHIWKTMENLLLFSQLDRGSVAIARCRTDVRMLLCNVANQFKNRLEGKQITLDLALGHGDAFAWVDEGLMEIAFKHLLMNAVQFNKRGGSIRIELKDSLNGLSILISDTGIGIPKDKLGMIFESFYQVARYLTREVGGLGIGLTIVKRIIEAHGGWITASNQSGQGSLFEVVIPKQATQIRAAA